MPWICETYGFIHKKAHFLLLRFEQRSNDLMLRTISKKARQHTVYQFQEFSEIYGFFFINFILWKNYLQDDQVPGNVCAGQENLCIAWKFFP